VFIISDSRSITGETIKRFCDTSKATNKTTVKIDKHKKRLVVVFALWGRLLWDSFNLDRVHVDFILRNNEPKIFNRRDHFDIRSEGL
jgi:hypothetical protein